MIKKTKSIVANLLASIIMVYKSSPLYTILALFLEVLTVLMGYVLLYMSREITNILGNGISLNDSFSQVIGQLLPYFVVSVLVTVIILFMQYFKGLVNELQQLRFGLFIDKTVLKKATSLDIAYFDNAPFYDIISTITANKPRMYTLIYRVIFLGSNFISLVIALIIAIQAVAPIFPILIILLCIPALLTKGRYYIKLYDYENDNRGLQRRMSYLLGISGDKSTAKEIRFYQMADFIMTKYLSINKKYLEGFKKMLYREGIIDSVFNILPTVGVMLCQYFVVTNIINGKSTLGDFMFLLGVFTSVQSSFLSLIEDISKVQESEHVLGSYEKYMAVKPLVDDSGTEILQQIKTITFKDVTFSYPFSDIKVFDHASFTLNANEKNGIVGINGSGKSTFVKLVLRLYDVTSGHILVNGQDVKNYTAKSLKSVFSTVFQDFVTYSFSIRDNVAFACYQDRDDDSRIVQALKVAGLYDELAGENGINLDICISKDFDDNGLELSGGQKQKLAIARCAFRNSQVLIMDEPDASLDAKSEWEILHNISEIQKGRGLILISHRLSNTNGMDRIFVFERGRVTEEGNHKELMEKRGSYYELYSLQAQKYSFENAM